MALGLTFSSVSTQAQTVSEELANGAKNGCIRVAETKGFQVKQVVSVQPVGTDGAKAVLSLTRNGQVFKLTCGYSHKTGAVLDKSSTASATGTANQAGSANKTAPANQTAANPTGTTDITNGAGTASTAESASAANAARTAVTAEVMGTDTAAQPDRTKPNAAQPDAAKIDTAQPDGAKIDAAQPDMAKLDRAKLDGSTGPATKIAPTDLAPLWWLLLPLLGLPLLLWLIRNRRDQGGSWGRSDAIAHGDGGPIEIHSDPGTHHPRIGTLYDGQRVALSGRYQEKWAELADGGWIPTQYLDPMLDPASHYVTR